MFPPAPHVPYCGDWLLWLLMLSSPRLPTNPYSKPSRTFGWSNRTNLSYHVAKIASGGSPENGEVMLTHFHIGDSTLIVGEHCCMPLVCDDNLHLYTKVPLPLRAGNKTASDLNLTDSMNVHSQAHLYIFKSSGVGFNLYRLRRWCLPARCTH